MIGTLNSNITISGFLNNSNKIIGELKLNGAEYTDYSGDYGITPKSYNQILQTKNKVLRENLQVKEIPYYETSNEYGKTIYIGSEVEINGN